MCIRKGVRSEVVYYVMSISTVSLYVWLVVVVCNEWRYYLRIVGYDYGIGSELEKTEEL